MSEKSEMRNPKYQKEIVSKINLIENALDGLTANEMAAAVCTAIVAVLIKKGYSALEIKQFYAEMAVNGINKTEIAMMIFK